MHSEWINLGGETPAQGFTIISEADSGLYIFYFVENMPMSSERMSEDYKQGFYEGMWKGLVREIKKELEKNGLLLKFETQQRRSVRISGLQGYEHDFVLGTLKGQAVIALSGNRAFVLLAMESEETLSPIAKIFLRSLEIYPNPR